LLFPQSDILSMVIKWLHDSEHNFWTMIINKITDKWNLLLKNEVDNIYPGLNKIFTDSHQQKIYSKYSSADDIRKELINWSQSISLLC
jgi:hypothetical protein